MVMSKSGNVAWLPSSSTIQVYVDTYTHKYKYKRSFLNLFKNMLKGKRI